MPAAPEPESPPGPEETPLVSVAVPAPLGPLTYRVPAAFAPILAPGCRVRVSVGRRRVVGVVLGPGGEVPEGVELKEVLDLLDIEPVLPADLLRLAAFMAEYYLAPIGECTRVMLPTGLPPWGDRRVRLTDAGALAQPRDDEEERLITALLENPRARLADLQRQLEVPDLARRVSELAARGRLALEEPGRRGGRYTQAVELRPGRLEEQLAACGRSPKGRAVVEYLDALGRPATPRELRGAVGCGPGVIRRLVELRLLRQFTQPAHLSLAHHRLGGGSEPRELVLRPDQRRAAEAMLAALEEGAYAPFLLHGMTGSGKTEVYLRVAAAVLELDRSAIFMVPEIALVPALAATVRERFGDRVAILHSNLSTLERQQEWERVRRGEARLVLGPRSALFAPVAELGLIVVDEEHESSYKQDKVPRYNGRDLALLRAREHGAVAAVVSATPSLESRLNGERGKLTPLVLTARAGHGSLPEGVLVDLRQEQGPPRQPGEVRFSEVLREEIGTAVEAGDQVILLRNRRGYAPMLLCRACGEDFRCEDCGLAMTYHRRRGALSCHYCGAQRPAPRVCPSCELAALEPIGTGTERVEEDFATLFPDVAVEVLDADSARRRGGAAAVLERFASGRAQVLIGTQMVGKGHHFPRVSLAAVLFADTYLGFPDFRAVERTYALLTQLAGRAGRGSRPGKVVIQTYHPRHYAIRAALEHDDEAFAREEMRFRRTFHYPPYSRMVQLLVRHPDRRRGEAMLRALAARIVEHPLAEGVRLAGPAPAPFERLRGKWRFQMLLRAASAGRLRRLLAAVLDSPPPPELVVDVDPYDLM